MGPLTVITWNCNGAFRNKYRELLEYHPDILVIQECENPERSKNKEYVEWAKNYVWVGNNNNKGLGVFSCKGKKVTSLGWSSVYKDHEVKWFLPCVVGESFEVLAVWAHQNNSPNFEYIGQFWKYLELHKEKMGSMLIAGDFNSNSKWDQWDRWWNHSDVVAILQKIGLESIYHSYRGEMQGKETEPTFFLQRNLEKSFHIDYFFGPKDIVNGNAHFEIGNKEKWLKHSDHLPLILELKSS